MMNKYYSWNNPTVVYMLICHLDLHCLAHFVCLEINKHVEQQLFMVELYLEITESRCSKQAKWSNEVESCCYLQTIVFSNDAFGGRLASEGWTGSVFGVFKLLLNVWIWNALNLVSFVLRADGRFSSRRSGSQTLDTQIMAEFTSLWFQLLRLASNYKLQLVSPL